MMQTDLATLQLFHYLTQEEERREAARRAEPHLSWGSYADTAQRERYYEAHARWQENEQTATRAFFQVFTGFFGYPATEIHEDPESHHLTLPPEAVSSLSEDVFEALRTAIDSEGTPLLHRVLDLSNLHLEQDLIRFLLEDVHVPINAVDASGKTALDEVCVNHANTHIESLVQYYPGMPELIDLTHRFTHNHHSNLSALETLARVNRDASAVKKLVLAHQRIETAVLEEHFIDTELRAYLHQQLHTHCRLDPSRLSLNKIADLGVLPLLQLKLREANINVNEFVAEDRDSDFTRNPLMKALTSENMEFGNNNRAHIAAELLRHPDIAPNATNSSGRTALSYAISSAVAVPNSPSRSDKSRFDSYLSGIRVLINDERIDLSIDTPYQWAKDELITFLTACVSGRLYRNQVYFLFEVVQSLYEKEAFSSQEYEIGIKTIAHAIFQQLSSYDENEDVRFLNDYLTRFWGVATPVIESPTPPQAEEELQRELEHNEDILDHIETRHEPASENESPHFTTPQVKPAVKAKKPLLHPTVAWKRYLVSAALGVLTVGLYPLIQLVRTAFHYLKELPKNRDVNHTSTPAPQAVDVSTNDIDAVFNDTRFGFTEKFRALHTHRLFGMTLVTRDEENNCVIPRMKP